MKNCSNTRELHSYMDIFFLSKLVTAADKPLDVSSVFLPFSARPDHIQKPISCISSHLVGWKMTPWFCFSGILTCAAGRSLVASLLYLTSKRPESTQMGEPVGSSLKGTRFLNPILLPGPWRQEGCDLSGACYRTIVHQACYHFDLRLSTDSLMIWAFDFLLFENIL